MFEDWSPHGGDSNDFPVKDGLPLPVVRRKSPWLQSARTVTFVFSIGTILTGLLCWYEFMEMDNLHVSGAGRKSVPFDASKLEKLNHLVMVAGHAVVMADSLDHVLQRDSDWFLESYQRGQDLPTALVGHIQSGVSVAAQDSRALLMFSGGQTRPSAGPRDEGWSYYRLAEHFNWWGLSESGAVGKAESVPVAQRTVTEDFATDSLQNFMFSLCRFKEVVGKYPEKVTVVSFTFKQRRFQDLHRSALRFPASSFHYVGLQPPVHSHFDLKKAESGEIKNSLQLFEADPYGCNSQVLLAKRKARNPFHRTTPYALSCPELKGLLSWCGPGIYPGRLPWSIRPEAHG